MRYAVDYRSSKFDVGDQLKNKIYTTPSFTVLEVIPPSHFSGDPVRYKVQDNASYVNSWAIMDEEVLELICKNRRIKNN